MKGIEGHRKIVEDLKIIPLCACEAWCELVTMSLCYSQRSVRCDLDSRQQVIPESCWKD